MPKKTKAQSIDTFLLILISILIGGGFIIFISASLGVTTLGKEQFFNTVIVQLVSLLIGLGVMFGLSRVPTTFWQKHAWWLFIASIIGLLLVFIPGLGFEYGGARRWISIAGISIQPAEILKITSVLFMAAWLSKLQKNINNWKKGLLPLLLVLLLIGVLLRLQPDTGTFVIISITLLGMFFVAGAPWKHILLVAASGILSLAGLILASSYIRERFMTFLDPAANPLTSGYQIQQSLIAIGSGGVFGRGFGKSLQKFNFLPEPTADSIFAVFAEEFGFIGAFLLISAFTILLLRGLKIAVNTQDSFSGLVVFGLVILIVSQSLLNIGTMLSVVPLSGFPLLFVSKGGTALLFTLASIGIIFNISRNTNLQKT